ncbi:hypothetical protein GOODEAATRI_019963 [Goodea atripinnis]|uniref:PRA1 family protein n=1 Tax=Goodea atripinnis TaxID=208336 RepID=A0ABV0N2W3_9TELE
MAGVQPPPLRSLDDFLLSSARFAVPDVRDLERWNNRMINNLLYYQTNYFLSTLGVLLIVGYFQPLQLFVGMTVVTVLFLGFVWAAENKASIRRFRRNHPLVTVLTILLASYLFISALGGVAVFLFGIAFPVLSLPWDSCWRPWGRNRRLGPKQGGEGEDGSEDEVGGKEKMEQ